jgi:hypothetical protein
MTNTLQLKHKAVAAKATKAVAAKATKGKGSCKPGCLRNPKNCARYDFCRDGCPDFCEATEKAAGHAGSACTDNCLKEGIDVKRKDQCMKFSLCMEKCNDCPGMFDNCIGSTTIAQGSYKPSIPKPKKSGPFELVGETRSKWNRVKVSHVMPTLGISRWICSTRKCRREFTDGGGVVQEGLNRLVRQVHPASESLRKGWILPWLELRELQ